MDYAEEVRAIQQQKRDEEEARLDAIVEESQADYDAKAEALGFQEPKKDTNGEEEN